MSWRDVIWSCVPSRLPQDIRVEIVDAVEQAVQIEINERDEKIRRLREALEKIIEPIPIGNNLPLKNRRENPCGVVYEVKPISIELAKLALQETNPENRESDK